MKLVTLESKLVELSKKYGKATMTRHNNGGIVWSFEKLHIMACKYVTVSVYLICGRVSGMILTNMEQEMTSEEFTQWLNDGE